MLQQNFPRSGFELNFATIRATSEPASPSPIVMLHGVIRRWQTFLPLILTLRNTHSLTALDFRGHGKSQPCPDAYRVVDYVEDSTALIRQHFQQPVILYGHSLGAMVAAATAVELDDRVKAVILEDPPFHTMGNRIASTPLLNYFRVLEQHADSDLPTQKLARALAQATIRDPGTGEEKRLGEMRDAVSLRFAASCLRQMDPAVLKPIVTGAWLDGYDFDSVASNLSCPTLLLQADSANGGMLTDDDADQLESRGADVCRVNLASCSHSMHWDRTTQVANHVMAFLASLDEE